MAVQGKKPRDMQRVKIEWFREPELGVFTKHSDYEVVCTLCSKKTVLPVLLNVSARGKPVLSSHIKTEKHKKLMEGNNEQNDDGCTQEKLDDFMGVNKKVNKAEAMFVNFLVEHDLSFHFADHASKLFKEMFPDSNIAKKFQCARTKSTAIVNETLGPARQLVVIAAMKSGPFSILMDETTDIGCQKQAAMLVKVWRCGGVRTLFYDMKVVNRATGENLFKALNDSLRRDDIPYANMIGFGCANAANMIGKHNSVWSRVKDAQPHCYLTGCVCHIAATCASDACQKIPDYVEKVVVDIFCHFYKSSVR